MSTKVENKIKQTVNRKLGKFLAKLNFTRKEQTTGYRCWVGRYWEKKVGNGVIHVWLELSYGEYKIQVERVHDYPTSYGNQKVQYKVLKDGEFNRERMEKRIKEFSQDLRTDKKIQKENKQKEKEERQRAEKRAKILKEIFVGSQIEEDYDWRLVQARGWIKNKQDVTVGFYNMFSGRDDDFKVEVSGVSREQVQEIIRLVKSRDFQKKGRNAR